MNSFTKHRPQVSRTAGFTARYPQAKKPRVPAASPPSGGLTMTEPAEATFAQEVNHAAQQGKIAKPIRTG